MNKINLDDESLLEPVSFDIDAVNQQEKLELEWNC